MEIDTPEREEHSCPVDEYASVVIAKYKWKFVGFSDHPEPEDPSERGRDCVLR